MTVDFSELFEPFIFGFSGGFMIAFMVMLLAFTINKIITIFFK